METIDLTPSWVAAAKIILLVLENGTEEGKKQAREELFNMAKVADMYVESIKPSSEDQFTGLVPVIKSLKEKQLDFLNETIAFYNSNNRGVGEPGVNKSCVYSATATSPGCAIGRHIDPDLAKSLDESPTGSGIVNDPVFNKMPEKLKELTQPFLCQMQSLHDEENFWNENGLSKLGEERVKDIKKTFHL